MTDPAPAPEEGKTPPTKPPEVMHDKDEGIVVSLVPNVCLTPVGNAMVPIPYNVMDYGGHDTNYTPTVRSQGLPILALKSFTQHCHGDEAGTGGGIMSGTHGGICEPITHEPTVRCEGSPSVRDGDIFWMNNKNTIGKAVLVRSTEVNQVPQPKPQTAKERRKEALEKRIDELQKEIDSHKGSWNPYNWARDSMREESLANAKSMLSDLESGTQRGVGTQINDGVVAAGDSIVEGAEGLGSGVKNLVTGNVSLSDMGKAISGGYDAVVNKPWFQGTRDAIETGQIGSGVGGIAPDVAGAAGLAKGLGKKLLAKSGAEVVAAEGTVEASAAQGGTRITRPQQIHHFATNKSKKWTPQMKKIADKYGLDLDKEWNKELMEHMGRHPDVYHDFVLDGMTKADAFAKGDVGSFLQKFDELVKQPVIANPDLLYKRGWE